MWKEKQPIYGDHIRVNRGLYFHHGIYASNDAVIHFASLEPGHETDPTMASVVVTDLKTFLKGGILEVREYTEEELKIKRSPQDIINYAFSQLGTKNYNLITNNCEHFANRCVFGESRSEQVNNVFATIKNLFGGGI